MIWLYAFAAAELASSMILAAMMYRARCGYQDDAGFHYDTAPE